MTIAADIADSLEYVAKTYLREFRPPQEDLVVNSPVRHDFRLDTTYVAMSDLLRLVLVESAGASQYSFRDKALWELRFTFRTFPCLMWHGKTGIRLSVWMAAEDARQNQEVGGTVLGLLISSMKNIQAREVDPRILEQLKANNVDLVNQHGRYQGFVDYFQNKLTLLLEERRHLAPRHPAEERQRGVHPASEDSVEAAIAAAAAASIRSAIRAQQELVNRDYEIAHMATAFVAGYFALIQHRLVLLTAFSPRALEPAFSVRDLLKMGWQDQFNLAVPPPESSAALAARQHLIHLATTYRNPLMHGGGGRPSDGMFVEWAPGYHSLANMNGGPTDQFMLWRAALSMEEAEDILSRIQVVEDWVRTLPYFPWIRAGIPVSFKRAKVECALRHLAQGTVEHYTEMEEYGFDRVLNFE